MKRYVFIVLTLCSTLSRAQHSTPVHLIDSALMLYAHDHFSGVVLVAKGKEVLYERAFGEADKEKHVLNRPTTKFNIASLGKMFTSTIILSCV